MGVRPVRAAARVLEVGAADRPSSLRDELARLPREELLRRAEEAEALAIENAILSATLKETRRAHQEALTRAAKDADGRVARAREEEAGSWIRTVLDAEEFAAELLVNLSLRVSALSGDKVRKLAAMAAVRAVEQSALARPSEGGETLCSFAETAAVSGLMALGGSVAFKSLCRTACYIPRPGEVGTWIAAVPLGRPGPDDEERPAWPGDSPSV